MIENRPWLTIFSHTMLILGIAVILFPLYVQHYARQNYRLDALGICHCLVSFSAT